MSSYSTRRTFFAFVATLAFGLAPAAAQDARRTYVPPALDTVHAVPSEHGMVVAQERYRRKSAPTSCASAATRSMPRSPPALRWP
ncbi:hypothetical protein ACQ5SK_20400 [Bradyrhizobium japonicum]